MVLQIYSPQSKISLDMHVFGHPGTSVQNLKKLVISNYALVICMYGTNPHPPPQPTPGTFHLGALESTGMSPTPGQISGGIDMELPPMSPGIPRISPPWRGSVHTND